MAVIGMHYSWFWGYGGDNGGSGSITYSFPPGYAVAQVSLSAADGGGLCDIGISHYEVRPDPDGPNQAFDFPWPYTYIGAQPPSVDDPNMTEVTAEIDVGGGQSALGTLN